jgi:hypothetical protein
LNSRLLKFKKMSADLNTQYESMTVHGEANPVYSIAKVLHPVFTE